METGKDEHMNYKLMGALLTVVSCGGCGFLTAAKYVSNIRQLENVINILDYMISDLHYRATPLPCLCRQVGEQFSGRIGQIFVALSEELETQISPNASICMASVMCRVNYSDSMLHEVMTELGDHLGRFDLQGQISGLEHCREHCVSKLKLLSDNKEKRLRSYQTLGLCAGAAIAILLV